MRSNVKVNLQDSVRVDNFPTIYHIPLCNQTWVEDVFLCVGLLNECAQVGDQIHYGDRLVCITHFRFSRPILVSKY